jgi:hypothetical protein
MPQKPPLFLRRAFAALLLLGLAAFTFPAGAAGMPHLAWSGPGREGLDIYYRAPGSGVTERVTDDPAADITPALSRDGDGRLRAFWVRRDEQGQTLRMSIRRDGDWGPSERLPTGGMPVSHPTVVLAGGGTLIVAWTGFDGTDDDIFAMTFSAGAWNSPVRVGGHEGVPDIHPVLGFDGKGSPWVYWRGFDGRSYSGYVSRLTGSRWSGAAVQGEEDGYRSLLLTELGRVDPGDLPPEAEGVAVYDGDGRAPLLPLRLREVLK